jgi:hypothetical protein
VSEGVNLLMFKIREVDSCYHGMARPRVADGGDGYQIRKAAANILNKKSRKPEEGWSCLEIGCGANNFSP